MSITNTRTEDRLRSSTRRGLDSLHDQSSRLRDEVRHWGHLAIENASDAIESLRSRGGDLYECASDRGADALEYGKERVERARVGLERFVVENPMKAVLIAAGVGVLVGYSVRASRARRRAARSKSAQVEKR